MSDLIFAVGDIHGQFDLWIELQRKIIEFAKTQPNGKRTVIVLGDVIDRGPKSVQALFNITRVNLLTENGFEVICLKGNHEDMMQASFETDRFDMWLVNGGKQTLDSIATVARDTRVTDQQITNTMLECIRKMPISKRIGDLVFVHAGVAINRDIDEQLADNASDAVKSNLMWTRSSGFLDPERPLNLKVRVIHGHTPNRFGKVEVCPHRINVDTGAFFTKVLSAVVLDENLPFWQTPRIVQTVNN